MKVVKLNMASAPQYWLRHIKEGEIVLVTTWASPRVLIVPYDKRNELSECARRFLEQIALVAVAGHIEGLTDEVKKYSIVKKTSDIFREWWKQENEQNILVYVSRGSIVAIFLPLGLEYPECVKEMIDVAVAYGLAGISHVS